MKLAGIAALGILTAVAAYADDSGLIFYAPFDNFKVDATIAKGNPKSSFKESIELRNYPGVKGGSLMLNENERCEYDLKGNFCPTHGTASLWVKPINWDGNDRLFHHFLCITDQKTPSSWLIYKYTIPNHLMFLIRTGSGKDQKKLCCRTSTEEWKRNQWHHIAATWDENEIRLYVDGRPVGKQLVTPGAIPKEMDGRLSLAPVQYWKGKWSSPESRTLIDEVKIYDRPLSALEISEMFDELNPYADKSAQQPSLVVTMKPDVRNRALLVSVGGTHLDDFWKKAAEQKAEMRVSVTGPDGTVGEKKVPFEKEISLEFPVAQWKDGEYRASATVGQGERTLKGAASLRKPPTPWLVEKPGAEFLDAVLPPWTPLKRDGNRIMCWGRSITIGNSPFPETMESQGRALLRSRIRLFGKVGGREFEAQGKTRVVTETASRIVFEGSQDMQDASLAWRTQVEYDGMVRTDFSIIPKSRLEFQSLGIEIPMSLESVRYIRTPKRKEWSNETFESAFLNYVWVGDEYRGLSWFLESDANFRISEGTSVVKVSKKDGLATLTLIDQPCATDKTLAYTIGFQATPLKPLPKDWQAWRLGNPKYRHCNMATHGWGAKNYTLSASLVPYDLVKHTELLKDWHSKGSKLYSYTCTGCAPDLLDEWPFFEAEWFCGYGSTFPGYKRAPDNAPYSLRSVCVASSHSDFLVDRTENLMKNKWADGIYTDIDHATPCDNALHGCGYTDAFGRRGLTVPIFKHRDLSKRLYGVCHKHGGRYLSHAHNDFVAPYHAFIDGWCPGEQYSVAVVGKHTFYMDGMKLDDWRAEYYSPTTGAVTFMLPQWGRISPKQDKEIRFPTENLVSMAALHDVPLWAGFTNLDVINEYWQAQADFGFEDAEFCPYWENPPVTTTATDVKISLYRKPKALLAVVVNFSKDDKEVELSLPDEPGACSVILPRGTSISGKGRTWKLPVRAKNFALVKIES